jgi:hypothetical protein
LLLETPTQQPFDATHLLNQRGSPYECFAVVSRSKLDGAVSVENEVQKIVRSLDVTAAHAHLRKTTGTPFVAGPSEDDGKMYSGDENALIALHKLRTHLGSPAEIEASKAWLRRRV